MDPIDRDFKATSIRSRSPERLLRAWASLHGVTQARLAEMVGVSQSEISRVLGGSRRGSADLLQRIEDLTGIPRSRFLRAER